MGPSKSVWMSLLFVATRVSGHGFIPHPDAGPGAWEDPYYEWYRAHRKTTGPEVKEAEALEYYRFGRELAHSGWLSKALKPIEKAIELDPENGLFHMTRGLILLDLGLETDAVPALQSAYKYGTDEVRAEAAYKLAYLGEIVVKDDGTRVTDAADRARREVNETVGWRHYQYGQLLAREGWLSRSIPPLTRAIEILPDQGRFYLTRGLVRLDLGNRTKGVEDLKVAYQKGVDWVRAEAAYNLAALGEPIPDVPPPPATGVGGQQVADRALTEELFGAGTGTAPVRRSGSGQVGRSDSLYTRLGGKESITAVVDAFLESVVTDARINQRFANTNLKNLKDRLVEQIGEAAGGPEVYRGPTMKLVHEGMRIRKSEFDALVEDLVTVLDQFQVPAKEQGELLAVLGALESDIVEVGDR